MADDRFLRVGLKKPRHNLYLNQLDTFSRPFLLRPPHRPPVHTVTSSKRSFVLVAQFGQFAVVFPRVPALDSLLHSMLFSFDSDARVRSFHHDIALGKLLSKFFGSLIGLLDGNRVAWAVCPCKLVSRLLVSGRSQEGSELLVIRNDLPLASQPVGFHQFEFVSWRFLMQVDCCRLS